MSFSDILQKLTICLVIYSLGVTSGLLGLYSKRDNEVLHKIFGFDFDSKCYEPVYSGLETKVNQMISKLNDLERETTIDITNVEKKLDQVYQELNQVRDMKIHTETKETPDLNQYIKDVEFLTDEIRDQIKTINISTNKNSFNIKQFNTMKLNQTDDQPTVFMKKTLTVIPTHDDLYYYPHGYKLKDEYRTYTGNVVNLVKSKNLANFLRNTDKLFEGYNFRRAKSIELKLTLTSLKEHLHLYPVQKYENDVDFRFYHNPAFVETYEIFTNCEEGTHLLFPAVNGKVCCIKAIRHYI